MTDLAIRVENLSKRYRLGQREPYKTLRDALARVATAPFRHFHSAYPGQENIHLTDAILGGKRAAEKSAGCKRYMHAKLRSKVSKRQAKNQRRDEL